MGDEKSKRQEKQRIHPFDQMMFGPKLQQPSRKEEEKKEQDSEESFDLFGTAQTMVETYEQLSPYVKGLSNVVKKFKS